MPMPNRAVTADYELGAAVLGAELGSAEKDPLAARTVFIEVSADAFYRHGRWRVPIVAGLDARLRAALPLVDMSARLVDEIVAEDVRAKARAAANVFVAAPIATQERWLARQGPSLKMPPMGAHQVTSIGYCLINPRAALFLDTGLGKTFVGTGIVQVLRDKARRTGKRFRTLVIAPKTLLRVAWGEDLDKFSDLSWMDIGDPPPPPRTGQCPFCKYQAKPGKPVAKVHLRAHLEMAALAEDKLTPEETREEVVERLLRGLYAQYPGMRAAGATKREERLIHALTRQDVDVFLCNPENARTDEAVAALRDVDWDLVMVDESSMMRSAASSTTEALLAIADNAPRRVIMTATPRPNSSIEYWGQMAFLDWCLGPSFARFKDKYFHEDKATFRITPKPGADFQISDIVAERSLRYRQRDCIDLPEETTETVEVVMSKEMRDCYAEMLEEMATIVDDQEVAVNLKIAQMMKLAQIGSGFIYSREGEALLMDDNPRIDETVRVCEQFVVAEGRPTVIWVRFSQTEGQEIKLRLEKLGMRVSMLVGGMKSKDVEQSVADFKSTKNMVMIANAKSAAFGHTWVHSNAMIFHSYDYSWEQYYQSKKRIMRYGQKWPCTYVNIVCKGSIDKRIMRALVAKGDASELVVDRNFMKIAKGDFEDA